MKYPTQEELDQFGARIDGAGDLVLPAADLYKVGHAIWCPVELYPRGVDSGPFRRPGVWSVDLHMTADEDQTVPFTDPIAAMAYVRIQESQS